MQKKTVFITGGADGIGAATVSCFIHAGDNVAFVDINTAKAETLLKKLDSENILFIEADVSNKEQMQDAVKKTIVKFGTITTVFSNAGIYFSGDILSTPDDVWDDLVSVNLKGTFNTIQTTLPSLLENGGGTIILTGSDQSFIGKRKSFVYGMTKGAIAQMTKSLALDYAQNNIRVNCVCPGTIDTTLSRNAIAAYAKKYHNNDITLTQNLENKAQPLGRIGTSEEVAKVVHFLASEDASFVTGALFPVDGGYTAK